MDPPNLQQQPRLRRHPQKNDAGLPRDRRRLYDPAGPAHIMGYSHHYGPAPWYDKASRADWNPVYFHRADSAGLGFDRTVTGSNALEQYAPGARAQWADRKSLPGPLGALVASRGLELTACIRAAHYGKNFVINIIRAWTPSAGCKMLGRLATRPHPKTPAPPKTRCPRRRHRRTTMATGEDAAQIQQQDAVWWRNACLLYFQTFSRQPLPAGAEQPDHTLAYYENLQLYYAPGTGPIPVFHK